ncbi:VOC family protein, partial [Klebsiella pneumoniae]|nr:VOC family protein [Klebsiella pneumoniae]
VDMVQELYRLAIENGGEDEGPPDYRPHYGADFYSAYVRDPDKNKIAFVFYDASKR